MHNSVINVHTYVHIIQYTQHNAYTLSTYAAHKCDATFFSYNNLNGLGIGGLGTGTGLGGGLGSNLSKLGTGGLGLGSYNSKHNCHHGISYL